MTLPKNILCPVDFSRCSGRALDYALQLVEAFGSDLHLLHIYTDPLVHVPFGRAGVQGPPAAPPEVIKAAKEQRAAEVQRLRERCQGLGAHREVVEIEGDPKVEIAKYAEKVGADLIVMGTHGRTRLARVLLGSVAERVVRSAPCAVLTVP